jgi:DNA invertase Pin-like site-specific DNA recombinase
VDQKGWTLAQVYVERAVSGRKRDRPELDRLLANLDGVEVVVIPKLDRLGRSTRHLSELFECFEQADVRLVSLHENIDTTSSAGRLLRNILATVAEFDADTISERVRAVSVTRAKKGRHHGGPRPYGYRPEDAVLQVVEDEARIVRRIYDRTLAGQSQRQITRDLNADGVPALKTKWTQSMVSRILRAPLYRGAVTLKGEEHPGQHEPIIDEATWHKVSALRANAARTLSGRKFSKRFLLSRGMLKCRCGSTMFVNSGHDTYYCSARQADKDACSQRPIKRTLLDDAVRDYFAEMGLDIDATRRQVTAALDRRAGPPTG